MLLMLLAQRNGKSQQKLHYSYSIMQAFIASHLAIWQRLNDCGPQTTWGRQNVTQLSIKQ